MDINRGDSPLKNGDITQGILKCAFEVARELGSGFLESVYEQALALALSQDGHLVERQKPIAVTFRDVPVGSFYADLLVDNSVIVEIKAVQNLVPEHLAQVINYLKATGIEVGLLINFGRPRLEYKRLTRTHGN